MELWCPFAEKIEPNLPTMGEYADGYPIGAVIHYTAGNYGPGGLETARQKRQSYFLVDKDETIYQGCPLNLWSQHAGESFYEGLGTHVSKKLVGIEVACAGRLNTYNNTLPFRTDWGKELKTTDVRATAGINNIIEGYYHKFTTAQEEALVRLLLWLHLNNPSVFKLQNVLGHDEVSPGRKYDPGASLSMSMPAFRAFLRRQLKQVNNPASPQA